MTVLAYYPGCTQKQTAAFYHEQVQEVCSSLGFQLDEIRDWNCCGATSAGKIDQYMSLLMPARNIGIAESQGYNEIVTPCSACYSRLISSLASMNRDLDLKNKINSDLIHQVKGDIQISPLLDLLWKYREGLKSKIQETFKGLTALCYYGCMLTRFSLDIDILYNRENPQAMENILNILGFSTLDWNCKTSCCGASAAVNDQDVAHNLMSRIFQEAFLRRADCLVTTCPMCQINLDSYQESIVEKYQLGHKIPIFYLTELVGMALGYSSEKMQLEKHFVQGEKLLKESLAYEE